MDTSFLADDPSDSDSDMDSFSSLPPLVSYQDSLSSSNSSSESVSVLTLIDDRGTAVTDYCGPAVMDDDSPANGVLHPGMYAGDIMPLDILPPAI
ncbi:hypothetical protein Hypma_008123 [Hypsizygus marmoreus]|uniref:Uncharacterized protein n=1 Tax=Hypsizygus marmoreus TaxID=39966 RepID=A0A369JZK9_HYPMA|nr:hypothetical protein Hypma_008123 [Hypsizygus marmoreus]